MLHIRSIFLIREFKHQIKNKKRNLQYGVQQESAIWRNGSNNERNQLSHRKSNRRRSRHECVKVVGPVGIIQLLLGAVGVAAPVGGRVPFIRRQSHGGPRRRCTGHPHRGRPPGHPEPGAGPAVGGPSPVAPRRGAAGRGAPRGAPGSPTTAFGENRLTEESPEQEAGPAGCESPSHP